MKYKNARKVLPKHLLQQLQQYVEGDIIYVPSNEPQRAGWGEVNGTREKYIKRNNAIRKLYTNGLCIEDIADRYHLSEHSIRKIVNNNEVEYDRP